MTKENQNNLILLEDLGMMLPTEVSKQQKRFGIYKCQCGKEFKAQVASVKNRHTRSCGCYNLKRVKETKTKHGQANTKLYKVWNSMIFRVTNKKCDHFADYGGRGITVCDEWLDFVVFKEWAMVNGYKEGLTLDRANNNGNYEPSNCRWVSFSIQNVNKRISSRNTIGFKGIIRRKDKFVAKITINKNQIQIGTYKCRLAAAYAYDEYVTKNNLEHTKNFD